MTHEIMKCRSSSGYSIENRSTVLSMDSPGTLVLRPGQRRATTETAGRILEVGGHGRCSLESRKRRVKGCHLSSQEVPWVRGPLG